MSVSLLPWRAFQRDQRGNVAMMFALTLAPLLVATGAALDYSNASNARATLIAVADTAALAGAKTTGTPEERRRAAETVFRSNLATSGYRGPVEVNFVNEAVGGTNTGYRVEVSTGVKAFLGTFTRHPETTVRFAAAAKTPSLDGTEIVFVLDTTASMAGTRINTLKSATNGILDEIQTASGRNGSIKVGIVPFSQYVNIGTRYRGQPWLNVQDDYQTPVVRNCRQERVQIGETNCRMVHTPARPAVPPRTCVTDGVPRQCGGSPAQPARNDRVCDPVYSNETREVCSNSGGNWVRWNGCVGSRNYPLETRDSDYGNRIPGLMGLSCGTAILPLTTNISQARSTVNALTTTGETYIPSGLIWGWRMLSPQEPLAAAENTAAQPARKYLILVTDGRNTKSPNYPTHNGNSGAEADRITGEVCRNMAADRANAIKIFTVAFEMDGLDGKQVLMDCSSRTGGQFYDATDAAKLREAFSQILDQIQTVKLTQ